jgi:hypothetical protein
MKNVTGLLEIFGDKKCVASNGRKFYVRTTTIIATAADGSEVARKTIDGNHPIERANARERMARKVQDAGFAWLGRSEATETARADRAEKAKRAIVEAEAAGQTPSEWST